MREFEEIYQIAAERKGGAEALEALLSKPLGAKKLALTSDDRWLAMMAKCLFQAGFNWKVVEAKWTGMESAFDAFDPHKVVAYFEEDIDRLLADKGIVRNGAKIMAVIENARFVRQIAEEHGSFGAFVAQWPGERYSELLAFIEKQGSRLGAATGQRMLRWMGRDGYILAPDVAARLIAEGVVDKPPTSKRDMAATQEAFNIWAEQSGRGLTQVSQILAFSM